MPTTSPTPEEAHKGYWSSGLTLPLDHPFWADNHPANRWNCKCSLEATSEPASNGEIPDAPKAQAGLEENPRHGHTFSDKHPYFPSSCGACPFYGKGKGKARNLLDKLFDNRKKDCYNCPNIDMEMAKANYPEHYQEYLKYKEDKNYKDVEFDPISGGVKATHIGHKLNDTHEQKYFQDKLSPQELELACHNTLFKQGNRTILLNEKERGENGDYLTTLDLSLNGKKMDIRSITQDSNNYANALTDKDKQIKKYNKRKDIEEVADSLCLYFHDASMYSKDKMDNTIERYIALSNSRGREPRIKHLYIVLNGADDLLKVDI